MVMYSKTALEEYMENENRWLPPKVNAHSATPHGRAKPNGALSTRAETVSASYASNNLRKRLEIFLRIGENLFM